MIVVHVSKRVRKLLYGVCQKARFSIISVYVCMHRVAVVSIGRFTFSAVFMKPLLSGFVCIHLQEPVRVQTEQSSSEFLRTELICSLIDREYRVC